MNFCVTVEGSPRVNALPSSSSLTWPKMSNKSNPVSLFPHLVCIKEGSKIITFIGSSNTQPNTVIKANPWPYANWSAGKILIGCRFQAPCPWRNNVLPTPCGQFTRAQVVTSHKTAVSNPDMLHSFTLTSFYYYYYSRLWLESLTLKQDIKACHCRKNDRQLLHTDYTDLPNLQRRGLKSNYFIG